MSTFDPTSPILLPNFFQSLGILLGIIAPKLLKLHKYLNLPKIKRVHTFDLAYFGIVCIELFFSYVIFLLLTNTGTIINIGSAIAIGMGCIPYIEKQVVKGIQNEAIKSN